MPSLSTKYKEDAQCHAKCPLFHLYWKRLAWLTILKYDFNHTLHWNKINTKKIILDYVESNISVFLKINIYIYILSIFKSS